jgi:hypothetical protein
MSSEIRRVRVRFLVVAGVLATLILGACAVTPVETPDPAAVPSGSLEPMGADATGPVVELGSAVALGWGWRYSIYPTEDGWCTQLEMGGGASAGCGEVLPEGDSVFGGVGIGEMSGIQTVEGVVTPETATVWVIDENNARAPATLMSLEPAGLEERAFVGFAPPDVVVTHLMAVAANGDVLDTIELP